jgi:suppressor for copper-sensitivity B
MRLHNVALMFGSLALLASSAMAQLNDFGLGGGSQAIPEPKYSAKLYEVEGTKEGVLEFTLELPDDHNTYAAAANSGGRPTKFKLPDPKKTGKSNGLKLLGPWTPTEEPEVIIDPQGAELLEHFGIVVWRVPVEFEDGITPKELALKVTLDGLMCKGGPSGLCSIIGATVDAKFSGKIDEKIASKLPRSTKQEEKKGESTPASIEREAETSSAPALHPGTNVLEGLEPQDPTGKRQEYSFGVIILFSLAGGFILNFMPCVLPVIGLKIASFAEQAGESSGRVIALNLFYSLGLLSVFMVLATLTAFWSFGWGQQNQSLVFNIVMASVVFAMGLSMIGVWEIPIPGLAMSTGANKLSQKEGPQGAFFKGVLTTILAVPCSGPGLATALLYCQNKPPQVIYAVFFFLALGMAAPYLILGAFPNMVRFLPKPGAWMETFKQVMGFVLMGTVVYLMSFIPFDHLLSMVALLFGIWMACWYFGRVPAWESASKRLTAAFTGLGIIGCVCVVSFLWLNHVMAERVEWNALRIADEVNARIQRGEVVAKNHLPWQTYSIEKLGKLTSERKTVLVDFTADWCPTCKVLEHTVLNTQGAKEVVETNQVETLLADWTTGDDEITETLAKLGSNKQIPVLAIFPADNPKKPIVLIGGYTQKTLIEVLRKAGPSKPLDEIAKDQSSTAKKTTASVAKTAKNGKG